MVLLYAADYVLRVTAVLELGAFFLFFGWREVGGAPGISWEERGREGI